MNEELQKALSELLGKANGGIDSASGFLSAELPYVISQLLMWHGVKGFILCFFGVVILLTIYPQIKLALSKIPSKPTEESVSSNWYYESYYLGSANQGVGGFAFTIISIIVIVVELIIAAKLINLAWLQIWIAPKVWLLEYAASLTK